MVWMFALSSVCTGCYPLDKECAGRQLHVALIGGGGNVQHLCMVLGHGALISGSEQWRSGLAGGALPQGPQKMW